MTASEEDIVVSSESIGGKSESEDVDGQVSFGGSLKKVN